MSPYPTVRLGDVLNPTHDEVAIDPNVIYDTVGIYSFGRGLFDRSPLSGADTKSRVFNRLNEDELVVSRLNGWEGALAVVGAEFAGKYVSQEYPKFRIDPRRAVPQYLAWLCRWPQFWEELGGGTRGSMVRRKRVHPDHVLEVSVPLPDPAEQRRIVARLGALMTRIEEACRLAARIADNPLRLYPALVDRGLAEAKTQERPVGDLADVINDIVHPGEDPSPAGVFIGLQHVESHTGRRIGESALGGETGRKFRFRPGDVVYGYLRPYLNKVWLADRHGLCSVDQYVLRPKPGIAPEILAHVLRGGSVLAAAIDLTHSLQLPRLRSGLLMGIRVRWPHEGDQPSLAQRLGRARASVLNLLTQNRDRRAHLDGLAPSVLNHAFNGAL